VFAEHPRKVCLVAETYLARDHADALCRGRQQFLRL
jgi:hypothetical protein